MKSPPKSVWSGVPTRVAIAAIATAAVMAVGSLALVAGLGLLFGGATTLTISGIFMYGPPVIAGVIAGVSKFFSNKKEIAIRNNVEQLRAASPTPVREPSRKLSVEPALDLQTEKSAPEKTWVSRIAEAPQRLLHR